MTLRRHVDQLRRAAERQGIRPPKPMTDAERIARVWRALRFPHTLEIPRYKAFVGDLVAIYEQFNVDLPDWLIVSRDLAEWLPADRWKDLDYYQHCEVQHRLWSVPLLLPGAPVVPFVRA